MNGRQKYNLIALLLTAMFVLSNVGLPIVLASCPMFGQTKHCPMCVDQSASTSAKLTNTKNTSCCRTVIAAERNKTDFVRWQDQLRHIPGGYVATPLHTANFEVSSASNQYVVQNVDRFSLDIPIFTSSLLI